MWNELYRVVDYCTPTGLDGYALNRLAFGCLQTASSVRLDLESNYLDSVPVAIRTFGPLYFRVSAWYIIARCQEY